MLNKGRVFLTRRKLKIQLREIGSCDTLGVSSSPMYHQPTAHPPCVKWAFSFFRAGFEFVSFHLSPKGSGARTFLIRFQITLGFREQFLKGLQPCLSDSYITLLVNKRTGYILSR